MRKTKPRELSPAIIVAEAIKMVDDEGLSGLTMRAIAGRLGVYPASVYWHVGPKSRLTTLAAASLFNDLVVPAQEGQDWQDRLLLTAAAMRRMLHEHPNFASVIGAQIFLDITGAAPFIEALLGALQDAGFEGRDLVSAYNSFTGTVTGWTCSELSVRPTDADSDSEDPSDGFRAQFAALDRAAYPIITANRPALENRAFMARWDSGAENPLDESFAFLTRTLIAGFESLLAAKRS